MGVVTFDKSASRDMLSIFGLEVDGEGYIIERDGGKNRVLTSEGEEILLKEWGGIIKCHDFLKTKNPRFIKTDLASLISAAKMQEGDGNKCKRKKQIKK